MPAKFSTWKVIIVDGKRYKNLQSGREPRLCKRCLDARRFGEYRYACNGRGMQVRGQFEDLRELVDVLGRSFCQDCMIGVEL
jgi:hypothetical protein